MDLSQNNFESLCVCSVRYALGRRTYVVYEISEIIKKNLNDISDESLKVILKDIEDHQNSNKLGDDSDANDWLYLKSLILNRVSEKLKSLYRTAHTFENQTICHVCLNNKNSANPNRYKGLPISKPKDLNEWVTCNECQSRCYLIPGLASFTKPFVLSVNKVNAEEEE